MHTLGERIRHVRENILRLNQSSLANKLGFSRVATISDYETNKRLPDITSLRKIASCADISLQWLLMGEGPISAKKECNPQMFREISTMAGIMNFAVVKVYGKHYREGAEAVDHILIPKIDFSKDSFALRVEDSSMSPTITNGATIGIDTASPRLVDGKLYAVWLAEKEITIRRVFIRKDYVVLKPDNPAFTETVIRSKDIDDNLVAGRLTWLYQRL